MPDDKEKEALGWAFGGAALAVGLIVLFRKCFSRPQPLPDDRLQFPDGVTDIGAKWEPNTPPNIRRLNAGQEPGGIYVSVLPEHVHYPETYFDNPDDKIGVVFPLPDPSAQFVQVMNGISEDAQVLKRVEAYVRYTYRCVDYINTTVAGAPLCDALHRSQSKTMIRPQGGTGCSTASRGTSFLLRVLRDKNMNLDQQERQQLIDRLEQVSQRQGQPAYDWLANWINLMPLYSVFEGPHFPQQFLTAKNLTVTAAGLNEWFNTGSQSRFVQDRRNIRVDGVTILDFIINAVIVALYPGAAAEGCGSNISFDIKDWSENITGVKQYLNTMADRPPAIGLAHELIHAYHNQRGLQPGREQGDGTTTLYELLCTGLGPWAAEQISENAIRGQWPPNNNAWPRDDLNLRDVAPRTIYDPPEDNETAAGLRENDRRI